MVNQSVFLAPPLPPPPWPPSSSVCVAWPPPAQREGGLGPLHRPRAARPPHPAPAWPVCQACSLGVAAERSTPQRCRPSRLSSGQSRLLCILNSVFCLFVFLSLETLEESEDCNCVRVRAFLSPSEKHPLGYEPNANQFKVMRATRGPLCAGHLRRVLGAEQLGLLC